MTRHGLGDPRIPWTILLRADGVRTAEGIPAVAGTVTDQLHRLAGTLPDPVGLARVGETVVVAADHSRLDGLSLLLVLGERLGAPLRSSATGVGSDRPGARLTRVLWRRGFEVALRPPAVVAASGGTGDSGDVFVDARHDGAVSTTRLVAAGAAAIVRWNRSRGTHGRRVSVNVGVSTTGGADAVAGDHSAYLRLTGVEKMSVAEIRRAISTAPLQPGGGPENGPGGRLLGAAAALLASRLGSSLLVSHLGNVATDACTGLAFYPVTGGASGVSLGAVGIDGHTAITLRARRRRYDEDGLHSLLETVLEELG